MGFGFRWRPTWRSPWKKGYRIVVIINYPYIRILVKGPAADFFAIREFAARSDRRKCLRCQALLRRNEATNFLACLKSDLLTDGLGKPFKQSAMFGKQA